jgi:hypothetical protein
MHGTRLATTLAAAVAPLAAVALLAGCGSSSKTIINSTTTASARTVPTPAPKIACDSKPMLANGPTGTCRGGPHTFHYAVYGNTLDLDTLSVKVTSVKMAVNFNFPNGNGYGAADGDKFVRVVIALTNHDSLAAQINEYFGEVGLITNAGDAPAMPENADPMDFGRATNLLNPGSTFTGAVSFDLTRREAAAFSAVGGLLEVGNFGQAIDGNDFAHPRGLIFIRV